MRVIFMGTPDFAVPALRALLGAGHHVAAVYTQPPRPAGRGKRPRPSPVAQAATEAGLNVRHPETLRDAHTQAAFAALRADLAVVVAYGLLLPDGILDAPRFGCVNIHGSILPRWRGAAPIQRAIMAGDSESGVAIMRMATGLDTGPVYAMARTPIGAADTTGTLHDRLAQMGAQLLVQTLPGITTQEPTPQPDHGVTYATKIDKAEAE
ncbi:MAG: methionyl-tRNA formyltransferase, partial [Pseudomonadota bacterium]